MRNSLVVTGDFFVTFSKNGAILHATKVAGQAALQKCLRRNRTGCGHSNTAQYAVAIAMVLSGLAHCSLKHHNKIKLEKHIMFML